MYSKLSHKSFHRYLIVWIVVLTLSMSFTLPADKITVYLAGDSTMANKEKKAYPETGWGMPFAGYMDETVTVDNRAKNGRSTKTFITEGLWQPIVYGLKAGDYVLIQFGHNDEVPTKASYTPEADFVKNLSDFVTQVRDKKGVPVLITPVARRKFGADGHVEDTHKVYAQLVRDVAAKQNVALIDLSKTSMELLEKLGPEKSKLLFNHLEAGQNPNYPDGKTDDTHFSELGARRIAELMLADIKTTLPELGERIVNPKK